MLSDHSDHTSDIHNMIGVKSLTLEEMIWNEFISERNFHLTMQFCKIEIGSTKNVR